MVADWVECFQPKLDEYGIETTPKNIYDGYQIMDAAKYEALGAEIVPVANQAEIDEYFNSGENVPQRVRRRERCGIRGDRTGR